MANQIPLLILSSGHISLLHYRLAILQSEMEEKDTVIALLEISDGSHSHREKIVELQEQKNILMKMIKQHVCIWVNYIYIHTYIRMFEESSLWMFIRFISKYLKQCSQFSFCGFLSLTIHTGLKYCPPDSYHPKRQKMVNTYLALQHQQLF